MNSRFTSVGRTQPLDCYQLDNCYDTDSYSDLCFSETNYYLLATGWDGSAQLWEFPEGYNYTKDNKPVRKFADKYLDMSKRPIPLLRCTMSRTTMFFGAADGKIFQHDIGGGQIKWTQPPVSKEDSPIVGLKWSLEKNVLVSLTVNGICRIWWASGVVEYELKETPTSMVLVEDTIYVAVLRPAVYKLPLEERKSTVVELKPESKDAPQGEIQTMTWFVSGGDRVLTLATNVGKIHFWRLDSAKISNTIEHIIRDLYPVNTLGSWRGSEGSIVAGISNGKLLQVKCGERIESNEKALPEPARTGYGAPSSSTTTVPITCLCVAQGGELVAVAVGDDWALGWKQDRQKESEKFLHPKIFIGHLSW